MGSEYDLTTPPPSPSTFQTVQLTDDHNCANAHEVAAVRARCTTDPNPIRPSRNEAARAASMAAKRGKSGRKRCKVCCCQPKVRIRMSTHKKGAPS